MNGKSVKSCTVFAVQAQGADIITVEGLVVGDGSLHPLQEAFREHHGLQCGFCTPGMITRAYRLLQENPNPSETEIRYGIAGNLCRCTGYLTIVRAIRGGGAHEWRKGDGRMTSEIESSQARTQKLEGLGTRRKRVEDIRFTQGKGNYVDDLKFPGMLFGGFIRSPYGHARVKSINKEAAIKLPGVKAVLTAEDLKPLKLHWMPTLAGDVQAVLADEKVLFQGQEVAFVVAEDC